MSNTKTTQPEETPAEAWARSAIFTKNAIIESLGRVGYGEAAVSLIDFPLMTYMPKDIFQ